METAINQLSAIDLPPSGERQPRARGEGVIAVKAGAQGRTQLETLRQAGCMKVVLPTVHRKDCEAILVNTAGGITGGDRLSFSAIVGADAQLTVTTQAAERAYRAQPGEVGQVDTTLAVQAGGRLHWLPQELILFDHAALRRSLSIDLAPDATLLMVEPVVFGRTAMGERVNAATFQDRISITRAGQPIYRDGLALSGDIDAQLKRAALGGGAGAMASLVFVHPQAEALLPLIRAKLPQTAGASLIAPDVLVMRQLAADSFQLRRHLIPVLDHLTNNTLPTSWRL